MLGADWCLSSDVTTDFTSLHFRHAHIDHVAGLAKTKTLLPHSPVCKDPATLSSAAWCA